MKIGKDLARDAQVLKRFHGIDAKGNAALVQETAAAQYAQFDDIKHPKSHGWWLFDLGTFRSLPAKQTPFEDRSGESMHVTVMRNIYG